ncbi:hypothetical protein B0T16DRAFT_415380 [Cercophora newfieldiana]|uniref:Uncharacterized protein n=1 Tax=Cercophora newfieldiana TaxID=92897 RepID=A0AA39XZE7_9PEZI|nr:hypothetical protein B0T16DRAFT_415380 [Cercophora newfieldiana]
MLWFAPGADLWLITSHHPLTRQPGAGHQGKHEMRLSDATLRFTTHPERWSGDDGIARGRAVGF